MTGPKTTTSPLSRRPFQYCRCSFISARSASFMSSANVGRGAISLMKKCGIRSVQIIGKARHMVGEAERVVTDQILGAVGGARLDRLDDRHVILDRTVGAVLLADRRAADHAHVREQVGSQVDQHLVLAEL